MGMTITLIWNNTVYLTRIYGYYVLLVDLKITLMKSKQLLKIKKGIPTHSARIWTYESQLLTMFVVATNFVSSSVHSITGWVNEIW